MWVVTNGFEQDGLTFHTGDEGSETANTAGSIRIQWTKFQGKEGGGFSWSISPANQAYLKRKGAVAKTVNDVVNELIKSHDVTFSLSMLHKHFGEICNSIRKLPSSDMKRAGGNLIIVIVENEIKLNKEIEWPELTTLASTASPKYLYYILRRIRPKCPSNPWFQEVLKSPKSLLDYLNSINEATPEVITASQLHITPKMLSSLVRSNVGRTIIGNFFKEEKIALDEENLHLALDLLSKGVKEDSLINFVKKGFKTIGGGDLTSLLLKFKKTLDCGIENSVKIDLVLETGCPALAWELVRDRTADGLGAVLMKEEEQKKVRELVSINRFFKEELEKSEIP